MSDPGFDQGVDHWSPFGQSELIWQMGGCASGAACLRITGRAEPWFGARYDLLGTAVSSERYSARALVRPAEAATVSLTLFHRCEGGVETYTQLRSVTAADWVALEGVLRVPECALTALWLLVEGPPAGVDLDLDDVSLVHLP